MMDSHEGSNTVTPQPPGTVPATKTTGLDWTVRIGALLAILVVFAGGAFFGCQQVRDAVANAIGAPTSEQIAATERALDDAETKMEDAANQIVALEDQVDDATDLKDRIDQRAELLRQSYAEAATRFASLTGPAADAMIEIMNAIQTQLHSARSEADAMAVVIATYTTKIAEHRAAAEHANQEATELIAILEGADEDTAAAIGRATSGIRFASDTATAFGIPGAGAIGETVAGTLGGVLSLILGGTTTAAALTARKRRREANEAKDVADRLGDVVRMTEKLDLIREDPEAEKAKEIARTELGPETMTLLHRTTASVQ